MDVCEGKRMKSSKNVIITKKKNYVFSCNYTGPPQGCW